MADTDPLKPGNIPGQNPNTPERLQGAMKIDADGVSNSSVRVVSLIIIPLAVIVALLVIYSTMAADQGTRPEGNPAQNTQAQPRDV